MDEKKAFSYSPDTLWRIDLTDEEAEAFNRYVLKKEQRKELVRSGFISDNTKDEDYSVYNDIRERMTELLTRIEFPDTDAKIVLGTYLRPIG